MKTSYDMIFELVDEYLTTHNDAVNVWFYTDKVFMINPNPTETQVLTILDSIVK